VTTKAWIGVGSNLGDRKELIEEAKKRLSQHAQIDFKRSAPIYETDPIGGILQGKFLNTVWEIETDLPVGEFFDALSRTEKEMGRVRTVGRRNEPRTIDLDLLFFGNAVVHEPALTVPHPRLHERWFVLRPLSDLEPNLLHPVLKRTVGELLSELAVQK